MPMPKPKTEGHYLRAPKAGQSATVRILADPIEYYVAFKTTQREDGTKKIAPVRRASLAEFKRGDYDEKGKYGPQAPRYCMAFPVLSETKDVMVFEAHQKTLLEGLYSLENNKKWGDLSAYDVTIEAAADGKGYTVTPNPKEPLFAADLEKWDGLVRNGFDLRVLLTNGDPFLIAGEPNGDTGEPVGDDDIPF